MSRLIITNIRCLVNARDEQDVLRGKELAHLPSIENAFIIIEDEKIAAYGSMNKLDKLDFNADEIIDATGKFVLPTWCDSHTHLVFASSRDEEFRDKIRGLTYAEIAAKGGGILNS